MWNRLLGCGSGPQLANRRQPFISQPLPFPAGLSLSRRSEIGAHGFKSSSGLLLGSGSGVRMKHGFHLAEEWIEINHRSLRTPSVVRETSGFLT